MGFLLDCCEIVVGLLWDWCGNAVGLHVGGMLVKCSANIFELCGRYFVDKLELFGIDVGDQCMQKHLRPLEDMIANPLYPIALADSLSPSLGRAQRSGARPFLSSWSLKCYHEWQTGSDF